MVKNPATGNLQPFDFEGLLEQIPELATLGVEISTEGFDVPVDSSNMTLAHWQDLVNRMERRFEEADGFVILHGSDTMAYTASALSFMISNPGKPIILTGAQLPIGILRSDARENLITSLELAAMRHADDTPVIQEVAVYFEYNLYRGNRVFKSSAEEFEAFQSYNYPHLVDVGVSIKVNYKALLKTQKAETCFSTALDPAIHVVHLFPGIPLESHVDILRANKCKALVLRTFGAGNAPESDGLVALLNEARNRSIPVINATQCKAGGVHQGMYQTSAHLLAHGVISAGDMTFEAALTKTMHLLGTGKKGEDFKDSFLKNLAGERSY